jgi:hypothetical protein
LIYHFVNCHLYMIKGPKLRLKAIEPRMTPKTLRELINIQYSIVKTNILLRFRLHLTIHLARECRWLADQPTSFCPKMVSKISLYEEGRYFLIWSRTLLLLLGIWIVWKEHFKTNIATFSFIEQITNVVCIVSSPV